jgi:hypothetical protein
MMRATFSAEVVAEWELRRATLRRASNPIWYVFLGVVLVIAALLPFLGLTSFFPYLGVIAFLGIFVLSYLKLRPFYLLKCPHCGKSPLGFGAMPAAFDIDICPHCYYWLLSPTRGSASA